MPTSSSLRLADAITQLLSRELASCEALQKVAISRVQGIPWDWVLFSFASATQHSIQALLSALVPFRAGELLLDTHSLATFYSPGGVVTQTLPPENDVARQILLQAPSEVQRAIPQGAQPFKETVVLARLQRDRSLADANALSRAVREHTWFGFRSLPKVLRQRRLDIALGAQTAHLNTLTCNPIATCAADNASISIFASPPASTVTVRTLAADGSTDVYTLPPTTVAAALGIPLSMYYGFDIRLALQIELLFNAVPLSRHEVVAELGFRSVSLRGAKAHGEKSILARIDDTIGLLEKRRRSARQRNIITAIDHTGSARLIGSVPTNEHEVLILTGKLEAHIDRVIPVFRIWEHTSQAGIDALVDIQLSSDSVPMRRATVEFEFQLSNFFRHRHPIRQTEFVVCWSSHGIANGRHAYGDGRVDSGGSSFSQCVVTAGFGFSILDTILSGCSYFKTCRVSVFRRRPEVPHDNCFRPD